MDFLKKALSHPEVKRGVSHLAVGLGIVLALFRNRDSVDIEEASLLKW